MYFDTKRQLFSSADVVGAEAPTTPPLGLRDDSELYLIEIEIKRGPNNERIVHTGVVQAPSAAVHAPRKVRTAGVRGPQP